MRTFWTFDGFPYLQRLRTGAMASGDLLSVEDGRCTARSGIGTSTVGSVSAAHHFTVLKEFGVAAAVLTILLAWGLEPVMADTSSQAIRCISLEKVAQGYRWQLTHTRMPEIGEHQVLIHVRAISINRDDLAPLAAGPNTSVAGMVMGSDAAGDVVAIGRAVVGVRRGDRVTNMYFRNWDHGTPIRKQIDTGHGARVPGVAADFIALEDTAVVPMPKNYSYEEAATLPTAGLTGWVATVGRNKLDSSKVVVIEGTGGVSTYAMQFAAAAGARIILTSSSDDKLQRTLRIAPHESINYRLAPNWSRRVMELTEDRGADLVVDVGGKDTLSQASRSLAIGGVISIVGGLTGYDGAIPASALLKRMARAQGVFVGSRDDARSMIEAIEEHDVHPVIARVLSLAQYQQALDILESGQLVGKIVLRLDDSNAAAGKMKEGR